MNEEEIKFPEWNGYEDLNELKGLIKMCCFKDEDKILEYAAKMYLERTYFRYMILFIQKRLQEYFDGEYKGIRLGINSASEIFEGIMIVPVESMSEKKEEF